MPATDDGIRERHGCTCLQGNTTAPIPASIHVWEGNQYVHVDAFPSSRQMTPEQARYLAAKLYRLARRVRARNTEEATNGDAFE